LSEILLYHVIEGEVLAETVVGLDAAPTLNGAEVSIAVVDGGVVLNDTVNVTATDIAASNGIIHVIDGVLLPPSDATEEPAPAEEPAAADAPGTIVDVAAGAGSFATLLAAAEAAGLVDALNGDGPLTVLAPTDDAFAALPEGTVEGLLEDPEALSEILLYHVIEGEVLAETVVGLDAAPTLNGAEVSIAVVDGGVVLNDSVNVTATDIAASNGVIHVIDGVLLPPDAS
ncbi:MAG: fasciclin domain-containing protein, partial [Gaiellaceae bacterium]